MPDRQIHTALLSMLRLGLWGGDDRAQIPQLSPAQWLELYSCAQRHTVEGILYDSFQRFPLALLPPRDIMLKWIVRVEQIERHNRKMNQCIREQLEAFHQEGIFPVLLKGQGIAACYDVPDHRISGDVDWYFERPGDYVKANSMLRKRGIDVSPTPGFSSGYMWGGVVTEHHKRMFDIHNPLSYLFLRRLRKRFSKGLEQEIQGETLLKPAPILMMIQVNVHILKHLLSFGVGIRQLCDSAKVYETFRQEVDGEELRQIYKRLGILEWIHLLHAVLVKYIGLRPESLPFELPEGTNADWMMREICMSGNFGFFDPRFEKTGEAAGSGRNQTTRRVWSNVKRYLKFAPMEAISFPLVHFYSKFGAR